MSMRSQVYEWDSTGMTVGATTAGSRISIFVGGVGNNITKPAETTATEFVVIEDIATTPSLGAWAGVTADTVVRGLLVDGATGVAGLAGPRAYVQVRINTTDYFLDPDNIPNDGIPGAASPYPRSINFQPALIANKLLEMGISINPGNVDWYKRSLLQAQA